MVNYMEKRNLLFLFTVVFFILSACNDPIFFTISQEVEPKDPRIEGSPSNFAVFNNAMYVASGTRLYRYIELDDAWIWQNAPAPGGRILQVASTNSFLYALCLDGSNMTVKRTGNTGESWETMRGETAFDFNGVSTDYNRFQYIFAAGDVLFIGAFSSNNYAVLYIDENDPENEIKILKLSEPTETQQIVLGEISGAVKTGTSYYISTRRRGIFKIDNPADGAILLDDIEGNETETVNISFTSIINLGDTAGTIALMARNGQLYTLSEDILTRKDGIELKIGSHTFLSTGALTIWVDSEDSDRRLLLAGRQDRLDYSVTSGFAYGYLEVELDNNGIKEGALFREPGSTSVSSVTDNDRFKSTIGRHPVNHIFQAPDGILFASTQRNGVWSYRERETGWQWNAEE
jgi:hypothetical protein